MVNLQLSDMNIFIKILLIFTYIQLIFLPCKSQPQNRNNNWNVGYDPVVRFNFNIGLVIDTIQNSHYLVVPSCGISSSAACISDTNGVSLLFTNGFIIYDKEGFGIDGGIYINCPKGEDLANYYGASSVFPQTSLILPKKDNKYYVFSTAMSDSVANNYLNHIKTEFDILNYSIVDMDGNGGLGKVTEKNTIVLDHQHYANCALSAVKHGNGKDWWLVKADCENNRYQIFQVTEDTIMGPYYQYTSDTSVYCHFEGQIYFSDDGTKMVSSVYGGKYYDSISCTHLPNNTKYTVASGITYIPNRVDIYDFDRCNGTLHYKNNYVVPYDTLNYPSFDDKSGISLSPDGKLLYMCNIYSVYQIDLEDTNKINGIFISGPDTTLAEFPTYGTMACGPNGKLYIGNWNGTRHYMSYIDSPNVRGLGCHFVPQGLWQPYTNLLSPPNMPNYGLGKAPVGGNCWPDDISETKIADDIKIYPNPTNSILYIEYAQTDKKRRIKIYDAVGQLIISTTQTVIDMSRLSKGVYFVIVGDVVKKIVKE